MAKSDDIARLPLPKGWPKLAKRVLVLVNSLLKVSFDIELGRRLDCASHHAREHRARQKGRTTTESIPRSRAAQRAGSSAAFPCR